MIVIQGLQGKPVTDICNQYQLSQGTMTSGVTNVWPMLRRASKVISRPNCQSPRYVAHAPPAMRAHPTL